MPALQVGANYLNCGQSPAVAVGENGSGAEIRPRYAPAKGAVLPLNDPKNDTAGGGSHTVSRGPLLGPLLHPLLPGNVRDIPAALPRLLRDGDVLLLSVRGKGHAQKPVSPAARAITACSNRTF